MATYEQANKDGNAAFKAEDFREAAVKFTIGISSATNTTARSILLSNRSSTYLKLGQFDEAVSDARECVQTRPDWTKAYLRLGKALEAKGDNKEACNVYANAMKRGYQHKALLLQPLVAANEKCHIFSQEFISSCRHEGKYCFICKKESELHRCSKCDQFYYCSLEHEEQHWPKHKNQCSQLAKAKKDIEKYGSLSVPNINLLLVLRKPFSSLRNITNWDIFWQHVQMNYLPDDFRPSLTNMLSWSLTLIATLCKFDMDKLNNVRLHVLGADDTYMKNSYFGVVPLGLFPLPNIEMTLVGPELTAKQPVQLKTAAGSDISVKFVTAPWHEFSTNADFVSPDLIIAYHSGIHDYSYPWRPTLREIVITSIPSVFTAWDEDDFKQDLDVLNNDILKTNILFKGPSPFPSSCPSISPDKTITFCNSYWIGFKGGNAATDHDLLATTQNALSTLSGISLTEIAKNYYNPDFMKSTSEAIIGNLKMDKATKQFNEGFEQFNDKDFVSAVNSFRGAIQTMDNLPSPEEKSLLIQSHVYLSTAIANQGDINGGIEVLKKAIDVYPNKFLLHCNLGLMYERKGNFHDMEVAFRRATELCASGPSEADLADCRKKLHEARRMIELKKT